MYLRTLDLGDIHPYERNPRINDKAVEPVMKSIQKDGYRARIIVDKDGVIIAGHTRYEAMKRLGWTEAEVWIADDMTPEQIADYRIRDNLTADFAEWDFSELEAEIEALDLDFDMSEFDGFEDIQGGVSDTPTAEDGKREGILQKRFIVPPFSVIDAKQGYYNERKRAWREKINDYGQARTNAKIINQNMNPSFADASLLDPVMSEAMLRWFMPYDGAKCFDVFAGDTVFGYVAATLGHTFTGIELREEQARFNNVAVSAVNDTCCYYCDDGRNVLEHIPANSQDMLFSCPPYYDLEIYSDKENDASNQPTFEAFYAILDESFTNAIKCIKENRFAVIVVANMRDKRTGFYYDFTGAVKATFMRNGMGLYNDMVLADPIGTAAQRAGKYMRNRKIAKVHQNILVFYKGDPSKIKSVFPDLSAEMAEIEEMYASEDSQF